MHKRHRSVLSRLRNGPIGLVTRFGCRAASNSVETSCATSLSPLFDSNNVENVPKQPRCGRESSSTTASTIKTSLAVEPNASRRTSSKSPRRTRATEEHTCPSPLSSHVDDDDIGYQRFLDFLSTPSGSPPLQNLCGASTNSTEGQPIIIEQSCRHGEGVSTKEENSNAIDQHLDRFEEEEEDAFLLSISNFVELEEIDTVPCTEKDASSSKDVDSAIAWCALAAVLGCKAPSSVPTQAGGKIKQKEQLWEMDAASEGIPDLPFDDGSFFSVDPSTREGAPDLNEISFDESDDDDDEDSLFIVPDLDEVQEFKCGEVCHKASVKEAADSTLTWSALALLLGAPAPASVLKRSRKVWRVNDEGSSELIPTLR